MAASRRAQIQALCGVRTGPLIDRVESYLAAVDIWSRRGNAKAVKNAGTGIVAVCCYLAAESLDSRVPDRGSAIRASGLTPEKFAAAERDFRTAVSSVSSAPAQALSGPSDGVNSAFAASLAAATPTSRPVRPSPLAPPNAASKSRADLLAKAQAIQAGGLFDQAMRSQTKTTPSKPAAKGKAVESAASASVTASEATADSALNTAAQESGEGEIEASEEMQPRRQKRRRMGKVVFGLAIHSSLNRLDSEEEAVDERRRRNKITQIQSTIERLRSSNPTWRYLESPRDFLVTITPSSDNAAAGAE